MRILITGGAGFIGSHLAEYHLNKGDDVHVVDDLSTGSISNIAPFRENSHFKFDEADILHWPALGEVVKSVDRVYHMAAIVGVCRVLERPVGVLTTNTEGCEKVLHHACGTNTRVMLASSSEVYGPSHHGLLSEQDNLIIEASAKNRWSYAISKLTDEALGLAYFQKCGTPITAFRIFNTIGRRQIGAYGMVVPRFIEQAIHNKPITVFGDGHQTRSFCDVRDMVRMFDALANSEKSIGEIVNVGNDFEITINDLAELIKRITKSKSEIQHIPYTEAYGEEYMDTMARRPELIKLQGLIDYRPKWQLEDTIADIISYNSML